MRAVVCGSFRKGIEELRLLAQALKEAGCQILSPASFEFVGEDDGFVYLAGEVFSAPGWIERKYLLMILHADLVWLHAPNGYVGPSASLEIGFCYGRGIPIFSHNEVADVTIRTFVTQVQRISEALAMVQRRLVVTL
jgi:nucleoside 2-deoxyribosyltransferase